MVMTAAAKLIAHDMVPKVARCLALCFSISLREMSGGAGGAAGAF